MKFPSLTVGGQSCMLLLLPHDWGKDLTVTAQLKASLGEGMTTVESRRPRATTPLHSMTMQLSITGTDCDDYRQALPFLSTQLLAVPMWADLGVPADPSAFIWNQAQYWINFDWNGNYTVLPLSTVAADGSYAYPNLAPLMFGRLKERPKHTIWDSQTVLAQLTINERSPWAFRLGAPTADLDEVITDAAGNIITDSAGQNIETSYTVPAWIATPDFVDDPEEVSELSVKFSDLGFSRETAIDFPDAAARWRQTASFTFASKAETVQLLAFFMQQRGEVTAWNYVPALCTPGADTLADPANLRVRFASDTIEMSFIGVDGWVCKSKIGFIQEISTPTLNQQSPTLAMICRLTYQCSPYLPNYVERYADWDAPITVGTETFNPWPMSLKSWKSSLDLQNAEIELDWAYAADTILAYWIREWSDFPILMELYYASPDAPTTPLIPICSAKVSSVSPKGAIVAVKADPMNGALVRKIPGWLFQSGCNATWGDINCGVNKPRFQTIASLVLETGISADGMTVTVTGVSGWTGFGTPSTWTQGMFAGGFLIMDGTDPTGAPVAGNTYAARLPVLRQIANSATAGSTLTLSMAQNLTADRLAPGTYKVILYPGCNGQNGYYDPASIADGDTPTPIATPPPCTCASFGNYARFGGFPFIPYYVQQTVLTAPKTGK